MALIGHFMQRVKCIQLSDEQWVKIHSDWLEGKKSPVLFAWDFLVILVIYDDLSGVVSTRNIDSVQIDAICEFRCAEVHAECSIGLIF